jgi:hypothetical protein
MASSPIVNKHMKKRKIERQHRPHMEWKIPTKASIRASAPNTMRPLYDIKCWERVRHWLEADEVMGLIREEKRIATMEMKKIISINSHGQRWLGWALDNSRPDNESDSYDCCDSWENSEWPFQASRCFLPHRVLFLLSSRLTGRRHTGGGSWEFKLAVVTFVLDLVHRILFCRYIDDSKVRNGELNTGARVNSNHLLFRIIIKKRK